MNPRPPPCEGRLNRPSFPKRSLKKYYLQNIKPFRRYLAKTRQINPRRVRDYTLALDHKLNDINDIIELKRNLEEKYTDAYGRALKNLFNFMEFQEIEEFNAISIEKWKKKIQLRPSGVREIYISDKELQDAYQKTKGEFKTLFKILVFSGMRLTQVLEGIKNVENIVLKDEIARIPINSFSKGKKKGFWIYLPSQFFPELKMFANTYCYCTYAEKIRKGRVSASTIRKWNYNFLIENNVPESIADFIQGRASTTVGSSHYLNKTLQADREYKKIMDKLVNILF